MDKPVNIVCFVLTVLQVTHAQPNLAALFGLGGFGDMAEPQVTGSSSCPYQAHPNKLKFTQVVNNRVMTQDCAPGTMFVLIKCSCDNIPSGGSGGGHMPGSDPRLESQFGGGGNPLLRALMNHLQGGSLPSPPVRAPPPPIRSRSPSSSNQLDTRTRQKVTSGIRPGQNSGGIALNVRNAQPSPSTGTQHSPDPSSGFTSVVDPSILPDVLPPEILRMFQKANAPPKPRNPRPTTGSKRKGVPVGLPPSVQRMFERASLPPTRRQSQPPASVQRMVDRASLPPTRRQSQPQNKSPSRVTGDRALPPGGLPSEVLVLLQRSRRPPPSIGQRQNPPRRKQQPKPRLRIPEPPTRRTQPPTRAPSSWSAPAGITQMSRPRSPQPSGRPPMSPPSGPRKDPLAALLDGIRQKSGGSNRGPSRSPASRSPARGQSRGSGPPGGNPLAALMAGIGGGSRSPSSRSGSDPLAALMASMGGGSGSSPLGGGGGSNGALAALLMGGGSGSSPLGGGGGSNGALAALLGGMGGSSSRSPSAPGGPLDVTSLTGNMNVATLLGETPGVGLAQNVDMTSLFNAQGRMGAGGGLAGLSNLNIVKLQQLDRQGLIDLSDLTPAGLAAANAHYSG